MSSGNFSLFLNAEQKHFSLYLLFGHSSKPRLNKSKLHKNTTCLYLIARLFPVFVAISVWVLTHSHVCPHPDTDTWPHTWEHTHTHTHTHKHMQTQTQTDIWIWITCLIVEPVVTKAIYTEWIYGWSGYSLSCNPATSYFQAKLFCRNEWRHWNCFNTVLLYKVKK